MAKNILLLFLSPVRTAKVGDEIVISEAYYKNLEGDKTKTTNESAVRYLLKENIALKSKGKNFLSQQEHESRYRFRCGGWGAAYTSAIFYRACQKVFAEH